MTRSLVNFSWCSLLGNIERRNSMQNIQCLQAKWIISINPGEIHHVMEQVTNMIVRLFCESSWSEGFSVEKALLFPLLMSARRKTEGGVGWSASFEPLVGSLGTSFCSVCSPWFAHSLAVHVQANEGQEGNQELSDGFPKCKSWLTNAIAFCMEMSDYANKGGAVDVIYYDLVRLCHCIL